MWPQVPRVPSRQSNINLNDRVSLRPTSGIPGKMSASNPHGIGRSLLLGMPGEIRNKIYELLCTFPRRGDHEGDVIIVNSENYGTERLECECLLVLMRTNRRT